MWEAIAVIAIIAVSTFFAARALWRALAGRDAPGCSACGMCPKASECSKGTEPVGHQLQWVARP